MKKTEEKEPEDEQKDQEEQEEIFYDTVEDLPQLQGTVCTQSENSIISYGDIIKLNMVYV